MVVLEVGAYQRMECINGQNRSAEMLKQLRLKNEMKNNYIIILEKKVTGKKMDYRRKNQLS